MSYIIGLTGGIGSGKSTVADLFVPLGVRVVDTDRIAHALTGAGGAAMPAIAAAFGEGVLQPDGGLDRAAMRRLAFADPAARARLESVLHPMIRREAELACEASGAPYVVLVVPLLVETGAYRQRVDRVLVVDCDEAIQVTRVMARSGLSADEARAIMAAQATRADRLAEADDVVLNQGSPADLVPKVQELHRKYLDLAKARTASS